MDDYYGIVGVDRNASREEIDWVIRKELRLWQRRASSADLVRRQAAERRVQQLSQARTVLLDERQRLRHDRRLDAHRTPPPPVPPPPVPPHPVPGPMPPPLPSPPPAPLVGGVPYLPRPHLEFRDERVGQLIMLATLGCVLLYNLGASLLGADNLNPLPLLLLGFGGLMSIVLRGRSPALLLGPWGVTVKGQATQHVPWERVRVIQETEVDGVRRVEIVTVDGVHILAPAPRGRRMRRSSRRFDRRLITMQRFHNRRLVG